MPDQQAPDRRPEPAPEPTPVPPTAHAPEPPTARAHAPAPAPPSAHAYEPTRRERAALRVVQFGAIAVMLGAVTFRTYELDRFFVPKELALHLTALLAGLLLLKRISRTPLSMVDALLVGFVMLGAASALLATNGWYAARALALTVSGVLLFQVGRALRDAGLGRPLTGALALAVVIGVATALLQAYGVRSDIFSINRAPGGTLGNRNFIAHLAAFGLPLVLVTALRARHAAGYLVAALGVPVLMAAIVMTRSRAAWLALGAVLVVLAFTLLAVPALRRHRRGWLRLGGVVLLAGAGVAAALLLPNTLRWRSDNPYLDSIRGVANYQEGSGRGRLIQYTQSLRMTASHPLLGVGPGNWAVAYPEHAARNDPSLDRNAAGTTSNPWPSSDWVAFTSERGPLAALLLAVAFALIAWRAFATARAVADTDTALAAFGVIGVLAAATVAGMFDAVLLLALPAFIVWTTLGALLPAAATPRPLRVPGALSALAVALLLFIAAIGVFRSTTQLVAMGMHENGSRAATLARAALVDPGNYRLRLQLARSGSGLNRAARCTHARAARDLQPHAGAARDAARGC